MRIEETIFFEKQGIVEVRSRPVWVVVLELWFAWVHELFSHTLKIELPKDPYWGDPMEAGFHHFYSWSLNHDLTIDKSARFTNLDTKERHL